MFEKQVKPDYEAMLKNIRREGTPGRVHYMELFLDKEVQDIIIERYHLSANLNQEMPGYEYQREIALQRFLGYDYVCASVEGLDFEIKFSVTNDTAKAARTGGRSWVEEGKGPITNWDEFEKYPWPDIDKLTTCALEWYEKNLPEDMCIIGRGGPFCEHLVWLMGYESLCFALYDQRDLVAALRDRIWEYEKKAMEVMLQFTRVKVMWASDDMGYKTSTMISPADLREFVLPSHKKLTEMCHQAGRLYLLHVCGNIKSIMSDLIDEVKIDAKHSFEDTIELVTDAKREYGDKLSLIGGIDVDFLCRADEGSIRKRVRETLQVCQPGGGYLLGTGNSVANYIPVDNYLVMLDEGRRYVL